MGRISHCPALYDDALQLKLSTLIGWGYIKQGVKTCIAHRWKRGNTTSASITITINMIGPRPHIILEYSFESTPITDRINLVCIPSNVGGGKIYYFQCPRTKKRARILYSINGRFLHREAYQGVYYNKQVSSKNDRALIQSFEKNQAIEDAYKMLYSKNFKKYYRNIPTKRYLRIYSLIMD